MLEVLVNSSHISFAISSTGKIGDNEGGMRSTHARNTIIMLLHLPVVSCHFDDKLLHFSQSCVDYPVITISE